MKCARSLVSAVIVSVICLAPSPFARAGAMSSCAGAPFAFKGADLNMVILPYFQVGASTHGLNELGLQLALLVKLESLYRAMEYERWGIVLLAGEKEECKQERIANDLLKTQIGQGKQLVMVWGKIYQQDEDVYVQTFARAYRNSIPDAPVEGANFGLQIGDRNFEGRIAVEEYAFPPERVPIQMMQDIAANFRKAIFLYSSPNLDSPKRRIPIDDFLKCYQCPDALAFTVLGRTGGWVEVRTNKNEHGYLAAHLDSGGSLSQEMPEVSFLQGFMGYALYVHQLPPGQRRQSSERLQVARQALLDYAAREVSAQEPETKAAALQLIGTIDFSLGKEDVGSQFDSAYQLVPYSSDARNLAAMLRVYSAYNSPGSKLQPAKMAEDFVAAAALDPHNGLALSNLQSFYELIAEPAIQSRVDSDFAIPPEQIHAQIAKVRAIREDLAKTSSPLQ